MFSDLRSWYLNQAVGEISETIKYANKIIKSIQLENVEDDFLWPPCYLPADIHDYYIEWILQKRFFNLSKLVIDDNNFEKNKIHQQKWGQINIDNYEIMCFSYSLSTHINGFDIEKNLKNNFNKNIKIIKLPCFPISLSEARSNEMLSFNYKKYFYLTYGFLKEKMLKDKSIKKPLLLLDSNYGTLESLEMFSKFDDFSYFQTSGFHQPIFNPVFDRVPQIWELNEEIIYKLKKSVNNLENKKQFSIAFPCASYKYEAKFWSFLTSILKLPNINKIGITYKKKFSKNIIDSIPNYSIFTNKLEFLEAKSREEILNKICRDYDFSIDMYKLGGSSLTPNLIKKGHPVFHQKTNSYFSKIQQKIFRKNKIEHLLVKKIPII